jgi:glycosyltransferase involved in cell wall biosynthesis
MHILMVAPEPIFEPRGTPLSVVGRLKALSDMGHTVDLVTYPIGVNIELPGVRIFRTPSILGIRKIKIGPSLSKLPLDFYLLFLTISRLSRNRYDLIHTHEEAGFWGTILSRLFLIPHIYDMHSSLPQQLRNFKFSKSVWLITLFESLERWVLKYASAVITICPDLYDQVNRLSPDRGSVLIENVIDYAEVFGSNQNSKQVQQKYTLEGRRVVLYAGTFEPYQGLELLIESAGIVLKKYPNMLFLMVGGHVQQVRHYESSVQKKGLTDHFVFTGQVPPQDVPAFMACSNLLLSPRISGTNTPLKIYSYLRSGIPVVATRILTHTQVLDDSVAELTDPTPEGFAAGILYVLDNPSHAKKLTRNAATLSDQKYSYLVYQRKFRRVMRLALERGI